MKVAVAIPCYRVKRHINALLDRIGGSVDKIYVVDDCCPEGSGKTVLAENKDGRVEVIFHTSNLGVGGAMVTAYRRALEDGIDVVVKLDGDGQMDPALIDRIVAPIKAGRADYTKGNRFYSIQSLGTMPAARKLGNALLSFVNKASSGYWNLMDPTNGYTAIHRDALAMLPLESLHRRYFFESDMLFRLGTIRAVAKDVPIQANYGDEESNLKILAVMREFPMLYMKAFFKRVFYSYFLRDFNAASIELLLGTALLGIGTGFGAARWIDSLVSGLPATAGTVMLAVLPIILGFQLLLNAVAFDIGNVPSEPLSIQGLPDQASTRPVLKGKARRRARPLGAASAAPASARSEHWRQRH